jgi:tripartite-type tricarboxylate transporter receptor subunit TctC
MACGRPAGGDRHEAEALPCFAPLIVAVFAAAVPAGAQAQSYPAKSIRYLLPFPPGGITDMMARTVGQKISEAWKQPVVVDNRPGGNALIGADMVAKTAPDGYTWLAMTITHTVNATLFPQAPYSFTRDLTAVSVLGSLPMVVVVPQSLPAKTMADLTALGKTHTLSASWRPKSSAGASSCAKPASERINKIRLGTHPKIINIETTDQHG